jgi:hypothetical protein
MGIDPQRRGEPELNIAGGVGYIKRQLAAHGGDVPKGLTRYNGGGDPHYVAHVMERYPLYAPALSPEALTQRYFPTTDRPAAAPALSPEALSQRYFPTTDRPTTAAGPSPAEQPTSGSAPGLVPAVQSKAQQLQALAADEGIQIRITSGRRSPEEQKRLYAQGRTAPGAIVTHAPPGSSKHESGAAFDIVPLNAQGQPDWGSKHWDRLGALGKELGLTWGGDFTSLKDRPHFELAPAKLSPEALSQRYFPAGK